MNILLFGVALLICVLVITGWVMLLSMPLMVLSAGTVGGVVKGLERVKHLPALSRKAIRGILCIDGLAARPDLARGLRTDIARVLKLAPPGTRPRACACVKESEGAFVGVLRVFNTKGHYLLRASGGSPTAVTTRFSAALDAFEDDFPARNGARRVRCPECDPRTCPMRRQKREPLLAAA